MAAARASKKALASLTSVATKTADSKDSRTELILEPVMEQKVSDLIRLATLAAECEPLIKERKKEVTVGLFDWWLNSMWTRKAVPDNPRVLIKKRDARGKPTNMDDMSLLFQVKLNHDLSSLVKEDKLEKGVTYKKALLAKLKGDKDSLSDDNAALILKKEIDIEEETSIADTLPKMLASEDNHLKAAAQKLVLYLNMGLEATPTPVELCTKDEISAILKKTKTATLKGGFFERIFTYCENAEQFKRLMILTKPTFVIGSIEFAIGDAKSNRVERLEKTVTEFLTQEDDE